MSENPLQQYFRTPAIHLDLPSHGKFYAPGTINLPDTGEAPVLPMTAIDEITYKTPDALFNGSAVVTVIESCVPAIKDAWQMPVTDLTAVLTAIRIASFGHIMEIETKCPKCGETSDYDVDLRLILESIQSPDYSNSLPVGDLDITFKPMVYRDLNENNKLQFEEKRLEYMLTNPNSDVEESEQIRLLSETFKKVADYTLTTLAKNIAAIKTPEARVTEEEHILEFLRKCENRTYKRIKAAVIAQKATEALPPLKIKCQAVTATEAVDGVESGGDVCNHEYTQHFTLDMTSFFDQS